MSKFKKGDRIRCIRSYYTDTLPKVGYETTVQWINGHGYTCISWEGRPSFSVCDTFWELVEEEVKMFEVGKTYKMCSTDTVFTCVWANETHATLTWDTQASTERHADTKYYKEYKAPEIRSVWVNVYPSDDGISRDRFYHSQSMADRMAGATRIKCIELKYEVCDAD